VLCAVSKVSSAHLFHCLRSAYSPRSESGSCFLRPPPQVDEPAGEVRHYGAEDEDRQGPSQGPLQVTEPTMHFESKRPENCIHGLAFSSLAALAPRMLVLRISRRSLSLAPRNAIIPGLLFGFRKQATRLVGSGAAGTLRSGEQDRSVRACNSRRKEVDTFQKLCSRESERVCSLGSSEMQFVKEFSAFFHAHCVVHDSELSMGVAGRAI